MFIFDNANLLRGAAAGTYKTETALAAVVIAAMAAVIATGELFTCTASCSGYSQQDIQNVMRQLRRADYIVSYSGTTLTITW